MTEAEIRHDLVLDARGAGQKALLDRDPNPAPGKVRRCACGSNPGYVNWRFCPMCARRQVPEWGYFHKPEPWHSICKGCTDDASKWGLDVPEPPAPRVWR